MLGGLNGCFDFLGLFFQGEYRCPRLGRGFELVLCLETSSDDRYTQVLIQFFVHTVAPDDLGRLASGVLDEVRDFHDLIHEDFLGAEGDVEQDKIGAGDVAIVEQGRFQRFGNRYARTAFAARFAGTHDGPTGIAHDGVDVVHVDVDFTGERNDFRDAFCGGAEDFVGVVEGRPDG